PEGGEGAAEGGREADDHHGRQGADARAAHAAAAGVLAGVRPGRARRPAGAEGVAVRRRREEGRGRRRGTGEGERRTLPRAPRGRRRGQGEGRGAGVAEGERQEVRRTALRRPEGRVEGHAWRAG